jgi:hypothetical protein
MFLNRYFEKILIQKQNGQIFLILKIYNYIPKFSRLSSHYYFINPISIKLHLLNWTIFIFQQLAGAEGKLSYNVLTIL